MIKNMFTIIRLEAALLSHLGAISMP